MGLHPGASRRRIRRPRRARPDCVALVATLPESFDGVSLAVQCGPRLLEPGGVIGIHGGGGKHAARTVACLRDHGYELDPVIAEDPATAMRGLPARASEAAHRATRRGDSGACDAAYNLEGGPSTGFGTRANPRRSGTTGGESAVGIGECAARPTGNRARFGREAQGGGELQTPSFARSASWRGYRSGCGWRGRVLRRRRAARQMMKFPRARVTPTRGRALCGKRPERAQESIEGATATSSAHPLPSADGPAGASVRMSRAIGPKTFWKNGPRRRAPPRTRAMP